MNLNPTNTLTCDLYTVGNNTCPYTSECPLRCAKCRPNTIYCWDVTLDREDKVPAVNPTEYTFPCRLDGMSWYSDIAEFNGFKGGQIWKVIKETLITNPYYFVNDHGKHWILNKTCNGSLEEFKNIVDGLNAQKLFKVKAEAEALPWKNHPPPPSTQDALLAVALDNYAQHIFDSEKENNANVAIELRSFAKDLASGECDLNWICKNVPNVEWIRKPIMHYKDICKTNANNSNDCDEIADYFNQYGNLAGLLVSCENIFRNSVPLQEQESDFKELSFNQKRSCLPQLITDSKIPLKYILTLIGHVVENENNKNDAELLELVAEYTKDYNENKICHNDTKDLFGNPPKELIPLKGSIILCGIYTDRKSIIDYELPSNILKIKDITIQFDRKISDCEFTVNENDELLSLVQGNKQIGEAIRSSIKRKYVYSAPCCKKENCNRRTWSDSGYCWQHDKKK